MVISFSNFEAESLALRASGCNLPGRRLFMLTEISLAFEQRTELPLVLDETRGNSSSSSL